MGTEFAVCGAWASARREICCAEYLSNRGRVLSLFFLWERDLRFAARGPVLDVRFEICCAEYLSNKFPRRVLNALLERPRYKRGRVLRFDT
jgi:hypothetical protein